MVLFGGARSFFRRSMMNISLLCNASPKDHSEQSILPLEPQTFDHNFAAHTVISNQNELVMDVTVMRNQNVSTIGAVISPELTQQQQQ